MRSRILIALAGFVFSSVFFINLCNFVFHCGCQSLWAGAAEHCNIHNSAGRHCPVCSHGAPGQALVYAGMLVPQLVAAFAIRRGSAVARLLAVLALMPAGGGVMMLLLGLADGYWR